MDSVNERLDPNSDRPPAGAAPDPRYLAYFDCFNRGQFFEAHEVLEKIWLPLRGGRLDLFYRALIQVAGAFVHVGKGRCGPAGRLLRSAKSYLERYPPRYEWLDSASVVSLIDAWLPQVEGAGPAAADLLAARPPRLAPDLTPTGPVPEGIRPCGS